MANELNPDGYGFGLLPDSSQPFWRGDESPYLGSLRDVHTKGATDGDALVYDILSQTWGPKKIVDDNQTGEGTTYSSKKIDELIENAGGGGGTGTDNYNNLVNKPQINGQTLSGNKTAEQLGLVTIDDNDPTSTTKAYSAKKVEDKLATKANISTFNNYYDKTETDDLLDDKADKSNTYTKTEVDELVDGVEDYRELNHKPTINSVTVTGDLTASDLGLQEELENGYSDLENKPQINGVTLSGDKSSADLQILTYKDLTVPANGMPITVLEKGHSYLITISALNGQMWQGKMIVDQLTGAYQLWSGLTMMSITLSAGVITGASVTYRCMNGDTTPWPSDATGSMVSVSDLGAIGGGAGSCNVNKSVLTVEALSTAETLLNNIFTADMTNNSQFGYCFFQISNGSENINISYYPATSGDVASCVINGDIYQVLLNIDYTNRTATCTLLGARDFESEGFKITGMWADRIGFRAPYGYNFTGLSDTLTCDDTKKVHTYKLRADFDVTEYDGFVLTSTTRPTLMWLTVYTDGAGNFIDSDSHGVGPSGDALFTNINVTANGNNTISIDTLELNNNASMAQLSNPVFTVLSQIEY